MRVIYLNSKSQILLAENSSEGTVSETAVLPRKVVEGSLKNNARSVTIARKRPGGLPEPSDNDNNTKEKINSALKNANINVQKHLIISV